MTGKGTEDPPLTPVEGAEADALPREVFVRFQSLYMGDGSRGNYRVKLLDDGRVFVQENKRADLFAPERYDAPYPETPTRTLDAATMKRLRAQVESRGFFAMSPGYRGVMDGGSMQILEIRLAGKQHRVIVDRVHHAEFEALRDDILRAVYQ